MFINIPSSYYSMVEFDELLITTGVDALVRLVRQKQRVELSDAAGILNIPEDTIEEWAGALEEQGTERLPVERLVLHGLDHHLALFGIGQAGDLHAVDLDGHGLEVVELP